MLILFRKISTGGMMVFFNIKLQVFKQRSGFGCRRCSFPAFPGDAGPNAEVVKWIIGTIF
jgi:hypothetical protein